MTGRKEFEMLFQLRAALGSNWNSSFKAANDTIKNLQNTMSDLNKVSGKIDNFQKMSDAVGKNKDKLAELCKEQDRLNELLKKAPDGSAEAKKYQEQLDKNASSIDKLNGTITEQTGNLKNLQTELQKTGINTGNLTGENEKLKKAYDDVKKSQENIANINKAINENKEAISQTKTELVKTVGAVAGVGAAIYKGAIQPAMEFESAFAGVKKTVDWGDDADKAIQKMAEVRDGIRAMAREIPASVTEISAVAEAAGQLGIRTDNITEFTKVMIALGVSTNLSSDEAADSLARFANITNMSQKDFDRLGSTLVALGNDGASTEAEIAALGMRLAGAGSQVGLNEAQIMGLASALASVGIEAEMGGSAVSKALSNMSAAASTKDDFDAVLKKMQEVQGVAAPANLREFQLFADDAKWFAAMSSGLGMTKKELQLLLKNATNLENFGKVAGMTGDEFKKAFQTDAVGAFQSFIGGLADADDKGESAIAMLQEMGLTEVRLRDTLLRAANASNLFNDYQELATKAWDENTALMKEAEQRYGTTESQMQMMKNAFNDIGISIGNVFLPKFAEAMNKAAEFAGKIADFVKENPKLVETLMKVGGGLAAVKVGSLAGKLGFQELQGAGLGIQKVFALFKGNMASAAAEALVGGEKIGGIGSTISKYFGGIGESVNKLSGGNLGKVFSKIGDGASNNILKPLGSIPGKIGGIFGKLGGVIANNPVGQAIGGFGANIGGVFGNIGGVISSVASGPLKLLGSAFGGLFGKAMPIIMIISLLSALFLKLNGGDLSGFMKPLQEAFEAAKPVLQEIGQQFMEMGQTLLPMLMDAALKLAPLFGEIIKALLPALLEVLKAIMPVISTFVSDILPVLIDIITTLAPLLTDVIISVLPIITDLIKMLLPIITDLITAIMPIIKDVLAALLPMVKDLIDAVLPVIMSLLQALMPVIKEVATIISNVLKTALEAIKPIIDGVMTVLGGLIDFITGVFTGNWSKAWEGVKKIFSGVFDTLGAIFKAPFKIIVSIINGVISGLNKIKLPDWDILGPLKGMGINIPLIPEFAKGALNTPDTFIAGEKGAELITNAKNRTVFTAMQTANIFKNMQMAMQPAYAGVAPDASSITNNNYSRNSEPVTISYNPVIRIDGGNPADFENKMRQHDDNLVRRIKKFFDDKEKDKKRTEFD